MEEQKLTEQDCRERFASIDADGNGFITPEDFLVMMKEWGETPTQEDIDEFN